MMFVGCSCMKYVAVNTDTTICNRAGKTCVMFSTAQIDVDLGHYLSRQLNEKHGT